MFEIEPSGGSKRDRVSAAIRTVEHQDLMPMIQELLDLLHRPSVSGRSFVEAADADEIKRLVESLASYGITLDSQGQIGSNRESLADITTLPDEAAVREHVRRMRSALSEGDSALLLGSSKELLESTAKIVLSRVGEPCPNTYPALVARALDVLMLHPKSSPTEREDLVEPVRKVLGGVLQIALAINELRNDRGTGHGRAEPPVNLTSRHGRLAAGAANLIATLMFDTLDDDAAPWRRTREATSQDEACA